MQSTSQQSAIPGGRSSAPGASKSSASDGVGESVRANHQNGRPGALAQPDTNDEESEGLPLPPPSEVDPNKTYVVQLKSGTTAVLTGQEVLNVFTGPSGMGQNGSANGEDVTWSDLVRALGGVTSTIVDDLTGDLSPEERQALQQIAQQRQRQRQQLQRLRRQRQYLGLGLAALVVAGSVWYFTR